MPTYEYECPNGHHFERFQKISDEPRAECPTCGGEGRRLLSGGAGFLFKGEGFYATDYRSDSYRKAARKESGDEGSGAEKGEGKGEGTTTGAPKTDPKKETPSPSGSSGDGSSGKT